MPPPPDGIERRYDSPGLEIGRDRQRSPAATADFTEARAKHLDMLQAVVCQLRGAGAATRRYCLTLAALTFLAALPLRQPVLLLLMLGLTIVFWALEAGYTERRRSYQALYDEVRREPADRRPDFRMVPATPVRRGSHILSMPFNGPHAALYAAVIALLLIAGFAG